MNTMASRLALLALLTLAACFVAPSARAASCTVGVDGVNFGTYDPTSGNTVSAQGEFRVDCDTNGTLVTISLGTGGSGSYANRRMQRGATPGPLYYNLYLDAAHATIFGNGIGGSSTVTCRTQNNLNQNGCTGTKPAAGPIWRATRPFFGLIPASQDVGAGAYTDTVTYQITF